MESLTKRRLDDAQVAALARAAFGPAAEVAGSRELTGGMFSAAYALTLRDGRETVLKVAPPPDLAVASHEVDMMRSEAEFYRLARTVPGVPLPELLWYDASRTSIDGDYLFLSRLRGAPLDAVRSGLSAAEYGEVRCEMARIAARLATIRGGAFGYPSGGAGSRQPTWARSFLAMLDGIAGDAERHAAPLPVPARAVVEAVARHERTLDEATEPVLVHGDLFDANVFVHRVGDRLEIEGIIDGERAVYGDRAYELQSWSYLRPLESVAAMLAAYGEERGRPLELDESLRLRHRLYSIHLHLIILTEAVIRGYHDPGYRRFLDRVAAALVEDLRAL